MSKIIKEIAMGDWTLCKHESGSTYIFNEFGTESIRLSKNSMKISSDVSYFEVPIEVIEALLKEK